MQSEPPLVVGRGLSVATGTVGVVLAVGLLWLMIPHDNRSGGGVAAQSSTSLRSTAAESFVTRQTSTLVATSPAELTSTPRTTAGTVMTQPSAATTTIPATTPAPSSSANSTPTTLGPLETVQPQPSVEVVQLLNPTAVALAPGHFVVATAAAVGDQATMTVRLPTGGTAIGTVVKIDASSGIAVLSVPDDTDTGLIQPSQMGIPIDDAVVMAPEPTPATVWSDESGVQLMWDPAVPVAEGSLVLDSENHLIGMCTRSAGGGLRVLDARALLAAINNAIADEAPRPWVGLYVLVTDAGDLSVVEVNVGGPSSAAGIQLGSVLTAIDGVALRGADGQAALRNSIISHVPGDVITLSVAAPGATSSVYVAVTVMQNPGSY